MAATSDGVGVAKFWAALVVDTTLVVCVIDTITRQFVLENNTRLLLVRF